MGIPTNIKTLLSGRVVEWARIEFKETWDAEASLKTICAFANDIDNWGGGYLVIGVKDDQGQPNSLPGVPIEKIDGYLKDLLNKCKRIQPEYMPITEVAEYQGKHFIIVWAPGGSIRPYSSPKNMAKDCRERICWIRKMASTIQPSDEELRDLYSLANNVPFDDRVNHFAELNDLNITLIQQYLREVGSSLYQESGQMDFAELCRSMNLISTLPEYTKPKNVGLMFFSLVPEKFFPYAQIDVVQFPDDLGGDQIIEKTFKGPLHQQLREQTAREKLAPQIARNVQLQSSWLFRMIPLKLKCAAMRLIYRFFGECNSSITLTNLGPVPLSEELKPHIRKIEVHLTPRRGSPYNCALISCGDTTCISITRFGAMPELEPLFFSKLRSIVEE